MNTVTPTALVAVQIVIFQFVAVRLLGAKTTPLVAGGTDGARSGAWVRYLIGAFLLVAVLVLEITTGIGPSARRIGLGVVSILSTAVFVVGFLLDQRRARRALDSQVDGGVRVATLSRRTLSDFYPPLLEVLPFGILGLAGVLTLWSIPHIEAGLEPEAANEALRGLYLRLGVAVLVAGGLLVLTLRRLGAPCAGVRLLARRGEPETGLAFDQTLRRTELRYFLVAKVAVAVLWLSNQAEAVWEALGDSRAVIAGWVGWAIVLVMMAAFVIYLVRVARVSGRIPA